MYMRLGVTLGFVAAEFGVSLASALDTVATITRIMQLRCKAFGERVSDDELDILLGPTTRLRREFWDTSSVSLSGKPTDATKQQETWSELVFVSLFVGVLVSVG